MKHTPGPWVIGNRHPSRIIANKKLIAFCIHPDFEDDTESGEWMENFANARLIAAAPVGYELAQRVLDCVGDCPHSIVSLAKEFMVIAKAEGEEK